MRWHNPVPPGGYSHDLLVHGNDRDLVTGTVAFVEQGLDTGGTVLVHSSRERVAMLRSVLGTHARLEYGFDCELYKSPMSTLFAYERTLVERRGNGDFWVTGTVPFGANPTDDASWTRYESLVNEVLGGYAFHALCTYDTRRLPATTVAAAMATHPCISNGIERIDSTSYIEPGDFLGDPRAMTPEPPVSPPTTSVLLHSPYELLWARHLIGQLGRATSALARETIDGFVVAVNEVLENGLQHGRPPVALTLWVETARLICLVVSEGGIDNPLSGYRFPDADDEPRGLWVARQFCEEVVIRSSETGTQVLLATS